MVRVIAAIMIIPKKDLCQGKLTCPKDVDKVCKI